VPEDDCHFIPPDLLVTTDSLVEGTHFLHEWSEPEELASKLIEVNVSDIAASGGIPTICFLNLGLSEFSQKKKWVSRFSQAFRKKAKDYDMKLVGGDTFFSQTTHLTLTVFGKTKQPWTRIGGESGDHLYLTGKIGDSELGLHCLKNKLSGKPYKEAITKHLTPTSRMMMVPSLQKFNIHACMDLTDGLIQDTKRLALASRGYLQIQMESLPISKLALDLLGWDGVLGSGEELELLFLSNQILPKQLAGIPIAKIGSFSKSQKYGKKNRVNFHLLDKTYSPKKIGFSHFS